MGRGWVGALKTDDGSPGDVETIQPHLRYIAAPGSAHHTGATYRLYHEASGASPLGFALPALDDPDLASYPDNWAEALYRRPRRRGTCPDIEDITAVATEWAFDEHPHMGAASGLSTTHSACLQGISKISSGASARPRCSLQPQPIAAFVEREFTEPATSPALLRVHARQGMHAVWVPPLGDEENAGQMELLFLPTAQVRILSVDRSEDMPIVLVEVSDGSSPKMCR